MTILYYFVMCRIDSRSCLFQNWEHSNLVSLTNVDHHLPVKSHDGTAHFETPTTRSWKPKTGNLRAAIAGTCERQDGRCQTKTPCDPRAFC